jgi:polyisoprenoid-binding protein YceI
MHFFVVTVFLLLSGPAHAAGTVEAAIEVNPAGHFVATFNEIDAVVYLEGDSYKAEKFLIPWSKLDSGLKILDQHARDYFHADKYPDIEIANASGQAGIGEAQIKLNGLEKNVKGTYSIIGTNFVAEFPLILSQFNVNNINFRGTGVEDEVKVKVTVPIEAKK